jgi:hypothetical protein
MLTINRPWLLIYLVLIMYLVPNLIFILTTHDKNPIAQRYKLTSLMANVGVASNLPSVS